MKRGPGRAAGLSLAVLAALLVACAGGGASSSGSGSLSTGASLSATGTTPPSTGAEPSVAPTVQQSQPAQSGELFTNPVINADFPDPFIASFNGRYYAYATGTAGKYLQVTSSTDLVHWQLPTEALYRVPRWMSGDTWAPEVVQNGTRYVIYYSGREPSVTRPNGEGALCISAATADTPTGPFIDKTTAPLECQPELGGDIDVTSFKDADGSMYLIWKNDGNCCALPTRFWMEKLSADGLSLTGDPPVDLGVKNDTPWEGGVIEAPTLIALNGTYYLFYSANRYDTVHYAVGYATSSTLTGPYTDAPENPILTNAAPAVGPGHESVFTDDDGEMWMAYHAWDVSAVGYQAGGRRALWIDPLVFTDGKPDVLGPDASPQPVP